MDDGHRRWEEDMMHLVDIRSSVLLFLFRTLGCSFTEQNTNQKSLPKLTKIPLIAVVQRINDDSFMVDLRSFNGFERSSFRKCSR
ncbi:hypothetical protein CDAR_116381 [Caerostris darwini]|uniref:Uncharacterized protein n=1 Tax=Caerostris darwini TaxID=1538125 RepID=A0AAV4WKG7_9ARAC|nr:hypothetical protein CDAR_116381 [Caerostris darwini]